MCGIVPLWEIQIRAALLLVTPMPVHLRDLFRKHWLKFKLQVFQLKIHVLFLCHQLKLLRSYPLQINFT